MRSPSGNSRQTFESTRFIIPIVTECLVQHLHMLHQYCHMQIISIGGITVHLGSCGVVSFEVSATTHHGKVMAVEAVVLSAVTTDVPSTSAPMEPLACCSQF